MKQTDRPQPDYTAITNGFQLVMPLDCEVKIEKDSPVRLLNAVMERMNYVSKHFAIQRKAMEEKISSLRGELLRVNRSIQAEGNFAFVKQNLEF